MASGSQEADDANASNHPFDLTGEEDTGGYNADLSGKDFLAGHPSGVGTVKFFDLATESDYSVAHQGTLFVAKYAMGHNVSVRERVYLLLSNFVNTTLLGGGHTLVPCPSIHFNILFIYSFMATLTTQLEAVNTMLGHIGEAPVNSISNTAELPVSAANAVTILDEISREVQSEGWHFNTEIDKELTPVNNAITLDQNVQVDHEGTEDVDLTTRIDFIRSKTSNNDVYQEY